MLKRITIPFTLAAAICATLMFATPALAQDFTVSNGTEFLAAVDSINALGTVVEDNTITLAGDIDLGDKSAIFSAGNTTIIGNGHKIAGQGNSSSGANDPSALIMLDASAFKYSQVQVTLGKSDGSDTLIIDSSDACTNINVRGIRTAILNIYDGVTIQGNGKTPSSSALAAVNVRGVGVINMYGGIITGFNGYFAGGVSVYQNNTSAKPIFNMYGGKITDCIGTGGESNSGFAGAVFVGSSSGETDAQFNMMGGTISNCVNNGTASQFNAGAIFSRCGNIRISGGAKIINNTNNSSYGDSYYNWGGAITHYRGGNFSIDGATITGNTATHGGAIAWLRTSLDYTSTIKNCTITGNHATQDGGALYVMWAYIFGGTNMGTTVDASSNTNLICKNTADVGGADVCVMGYNQGSTSSDAPNTVSLPTNISWWDDYEGARYPSTKSASDNPVAPPGKYYAEIIAAAPVGVSYVFESEDGSALPTEVTDLLPVDTRMWDSTETATPMDLDATKMETTSNGKPGVRMSDGWWEFEGWDPAEVVNPDVPITFTGTWKFVEFEYSSSYSFASSDASLSLPDAVKALLPQDTRTFKVGETVTPLQPAQTEVKVDGGTWKFKGYTPASAVMSANGVSFEGTWEYVADPKPVTPDPSSPDSNNPGNGNGDGAQNSSTGNAPATGDETSTLMTICWLVALSAFGVAFVARQIGRGVQKNG